MGIRILCVDGSWADISQLCVFSSISTVTLPQMLVQVLNRGATPCAVMWSKDTQWSPLLELLQSTFHHRTQQPSSHLGVPASVVGTTHISSAYFARSTSDSILSIPPPSPIPPIAPTSPTPPTPPGCATHTSSYFPSASLNPPVAHAAELMEPRQCASLWDSILALPAHLNFRELLAIVIAACCRWLPQERPTMRCVAAVMRAFLPSEVSPATGFDDLIVAGRLHVFHRRDLWLAAQLLERHQHVTELHIWCDLLETDSERVAQAMMSASRLERIWVLLVFFFSFESSYFVTGVGYDCNDKQRPMVHCIVLVMHMSSPLLCHALGFSRMHASHVINEPQVPRGMNEFLLRQLAVWFRVQAPPWRFVPLCVWLLDGRHTSGRRPVLFPGIHLVSCVRVVVDGRHISLSENKLHSSEVLVWTAALGQSTGVNFESIDLSHNRIGPPGSLHSQFSNPHIS